jgi:ribonuclease HII
LDGSGVVAERFAEYFANWGIRLPEGGVKLKEPGVIHQAGWTIRYVFGSDAAGSYLEFYATHRMTNDRRVRIYSSGETKGLEALETMYGYDPKIPGDQERAVRENRRRNTRVTKELEAHDLYPEGNINAYLATHDVPMDKTTSPAGRKDRLIFEREARAAGYSLIAGVDEVGRAAWAGPMFAAAVILPGDIDPSGLGDSKKKSVNSLVTAYERIRSEAIAIGVAQVSARDIDVRGIDACHMQLLRDAVAALGTQPDFVLVDHYCIPDLPMAQKAITKGDDLSASIAAASIIAKVECDRVMESADAIYPEYDFAQNKGYGGSTGSKHREAMERIGPSEIHRRSVRPVKDWLKRHGQQPS